VQQAFESFPFPCSSSHCFCQLKGYAKCCKREHLTFLYKKKLGQISGKVTRSSSHTAEHKCIRREKGRKPVDRINHLISILQTLKIKKKDCIFWQYLGQKDLGKIKAAAR